MQVQPYLSFEGRCDEAIEFYKKAIDAKVDMLMRFKEAPDQSMISPGNADKVMHAAVHAGDTQLLMSDGRCTGSPNFYGIALAISVPTDVDAERVFSALSEGGLRTRAHAVVDKAVTHLQGMEMGWTMSIDKLEAMLSAAR